MENTVRENSEKVMLIDFINWCLSKGFKIVNHTPEQIAQAYIRYKREIKMPIKAHGGVHLDELH